MEKRRRCAWFAFAGGLLVTVMASSIGAAGPDCRIDVSSDLVTVDMGGQRLLSYQRTPNPLKPYLQQLWTPGGLPVLRDSPVDHPHHHGLMFALRVENVDFWVEEAAHLDPADSSSTGSVGRQVPRTGGSVNVVDTLAGRDVALSAHIDWLDGEQKRLIVEDREITLHAAPESTSRTWLTWRTRLETAPGVESVTLRGTHYAGLGLRFAAALDGNGEIQTDGRAMGENVRGDEWLHKGSWIAYCATTENRPTTVVMFDHPGNYRPVTWFGMVRPFAFLGATLGVDRQPIILSRDAPLDLRYGVAAVDGALSAAQIEKLRQAWLATNATTEEH